MDQKLTDALCTTIANWMTAVLALPFDDQRRQAFVACMFAEGADVQVVARLRQGAIVIEGTAQGKRTELYRQDVEPLKLTDFFWHDEKGELVEAARQ